MKLLIVDNRIEYFVSHRRPLAEAARSEGHDVHVAALTPGHAAAIGQAGFPFYPLALDRHRSRLVQEMSVLAALRRRLRELRADVCHFITLRAVFHGLLALASGAGRPRRIVCSVTGLGYLFTDDGVKARLGRIVLGNGIRLLRRLTRPVFVFQNPDDRALFARRGWVPLDQSRLIRGSGVDTDVYRPSPLPPGVPVVLFCARYLRHKGVFEFLRAAERLKAEGIAARFAIAGGIDPDNPASATRAEIDDWVGRGVVEDWGFCGDMPERLRAVSLVVLPSWREGLPKVVLEAAASGRAVVTADVPGCREAIVDGLTGLLVPVRDPAALAAAIRGLIADPARLRAMGEAGRRDVEARFSSDAVAAAILDLYRPSQP